MLLYVYSKGITHNHKTIRNTNTQHSKAILLRKDTLLKKNTKVNKKEISQLEIIPLADAPPPYYLLPQQQSYPTDTTPVPATQQQLVS